MRRSPPTGDRHGEQGGEGEMMDLDGYITLVCLVYLLEPGLGLLRARRVRRAPAGGDLIRVPPLHASPS